MRVYTTLVVILSSLLLIKGDCKPWDYSNSAEWDTLCDDYALCKSGQRQSPVDITTPDTYPYPAPVTNFTLIPLIKSSNISVNYTGSGLSTMISTDKEVFALPDGNRLYLSQVVVHSTSEHTVNTFPFNLELHFPLQNANKSIQSILAFFVKTNKTLYDNQTDPFLQELATLNTATTNLTTLAAFLNRTRTFVTYNGSLTYPPCTEGVQWLIQLNPLPASTNIVNMLQKLSVGRRDIDTSPAYNNVVFSHFYYNASTVAKPDPSIIIATTGTITTATATTATATTASATTSSTSTSSTSTSTTGSATTSQTVSSEEGSESVSPTSGTVITQPIVTKSAAGAIVVSVLCAGGFLACIVKDFRDRYEKNRQ